MGRAAIAAGAGGEGGEQIDFGVKFQVVAGADGGGFHEILVLFARKAGAHKNVEDVVDVGFG